MGSGYGVVVDNIAFLMEALQTKVPLIQERAISVYKQEELQAALARGGAPLIGIVYVGTTANRDDTKSPAQTQLANSVFALVVIDAPEIKSEPGDIPLRVAEILDSTRKAVLLQMAPTGRPWRFVSERPEEFGDRVAFVQRWQTLVPLL